MPRRPPPHTASNRNSVFLGSALEMNPADLTAFTEDARADNPQLYYIDRIGTLKADPATQYIRDMDIRQLWTALWQPPYAVYTVHRQHALDVYKEKEKQAKKAATDATEQQKQEHQKTCLAYLGTLSEDNLFNAAIWIKVVQKGTLPSGVYEISDEYLEEAYKRISERTWNRRIDMLTPDSLKLVIVSKSMPKPYVTYAKRRAEQYVRKAVEEAAQEQEAQNNHRRK